MAHAGRVGRIDPTLLDGGRNDARDALGTVAQTDFLNRYVRILYCHGFGVAVFWKSLECRIAWSMRKQCSAMESLAFQDGPPGLLDGRCGPSGLTRRGFCAVSGP